MADYNSDITKKNFVCNGCGDDTASEDLCDECEAKEKHHPSDDEVREYMELHNADAVGQGENAWTMEDALYHLELSGKYYQPETYDCKGCGATEQSTKELCDSCSGKNTEKQQEKNCLHNYEDNICKTCGDVEVDENEVSECPNCDKKAKSIDIDYLGDGVYQCPNCKN